MSNVIIALFGQYGYDRAAQGVAGAGARLAATFGGDVTAVIVGPTDSAMTSGLAEVAKQVLVVDDKRLQEYQPELALAALEQACKDKGAKAILLSNDTYSQELVPRLAARLGGSSMADAIELVGADGRVRASRMAYGGKAVSVYDLKKEPSVVWVRARSLAPPEETGAGGTVETVAVELPEPKIRITGREVEQAAGVRLEDAEIIVSGGRGLGGPEPFENEIKALADAMNAQQGASRAACDAGWVPPNWQVGQTGKKVAPELYLAIAISGASQHLLGMSDSKVIAAINTDSDAPIFKHCDFGIVEDYKNVVPLLTEKLKQLGG